MIRKQHLVVLLLLVGAIFVAYVWRTGSSGTWVFPSRSPGTGEDVVVAEFSPTEGATAGMVVRQVEKLYCLRDIATVRVEGDFVHVVARRSRAQDVRSALWGLKSLQGQVRFISSGLGKGREIPGSLTVESAIEARRSKKSDSVSLSGRVASSGRMTTYGMPFGDDLSFVKLEPVLRNLKDGEVDHWPIGTSHLILEYRDGFGTTFDAGARLQVNRVEGQRGGRVVFLEARPGYEEEWAAFREDHRGEYIEVAVGVVSLGTFSPRQFGGDALDLQVGGSYERLALFVDSLHWGQIQGRIVLK